MKNLFFLFLFSVFAFSAQAQNHGYIGSDTLTVAGAADTIYLHVGGVDVSDSRNLSRYGELEFTARIDSLSGATGGTWTVEYTNADDPTEIGAEWFTAPAASSVFTYMNGATAVVAASTTAYSFAVNGTRSLLYWKDPNFNATHARLRFVVTSTTQSDRMRAWYSLR